MRPGTAAPLTMTKATITNREAPCFGTLSQEPEKLLAFFKIAQKLSNILRLL